MARTKLRGPGDKPTAAKKAGRAGGAGKAPRDGKPDGEAAKMTVSGWKANEVAAAMTKAGYPTEAVDEADTDSGSPIASLRIHIPTSIKEACADESSRYRIADVAVVHPRPGSVAARTGRVMLAATDGRMLAVVPTLIEKSSDDLPDKLRAEWIPRHLASPCGKAPRSLRMTLGDGASLFGPAPTWVDEAGGMFSIQADGGMFPPVGGMMGRSADATLLVAVNVKLLAKLAKAVNDPNGNSPDVVCLLLRKPMGQSKVLDRPIGVVGDTGAGMLMPVKAVESESLGRFDELASAIDAYSPAVREPENLAAPDEAVDETTGEVLSQ